MQDCPWNILGLTVILSSFDIIGLLVPGLSSGFRRISIVIVNKYRRNATQRCQNVLISIRSWHEIWACDPNNLRPQTLPARFPPRGWCVSGPVPGERFIGLDKVDSLRSIHPTGFCVGSTFLGWTGWCPPTRSHFENVGNATLCVPVRSETNDMRNWKTIVNPMSIKDRSSNLEGSNSSFRSALTSSQSFLLEWEGSSWAISISCSVFFRDSPACWITLGGCFFFDFDCSP